MSVVNWELDHRQPTVKYVGRIIEFIGHDPRPEAKTPGGKIARFRSSRGLSQLEFSAEIGVDQATLALWETDHRKPTGERLRRLKIAMGEPVSDPPITFGSRLREARNRASLTQAQLALQLGVCRATVSQWEADRHRPEGALGKEVEKFISGPDGQTLKG